MIRDIAILKDEKNMEFIFNALDQGFKLQWVWPHTLTALAGANGCFRIHLRTVGENRQVFFSKGKEQLFIEPLADLDWSRLKYQQGFLVYKGIVYKLYNRHK